MALDLGIPSIFPTSTDSDLGVQKKPRATFTKEFFIRSDGTDRQGNYITNDLATGGGIGLITFQVPADFTAFKKLFVVVIATTGHNNWPMDVAFSITPVNDDYTGGFDESFTPDLQTDKLEEVNIGTGNLSTAKAGDYIGLEIENNHADDKLDLIG